MHGEPDQRHRSAQAAVRPLHNPGLLASLKCPNQITFGLSSAPLGTCAEVNWANFAHELGHAVAGLQHGGAGSNIPEGGGDGNCNPIYPSLMNYAYDHSRNSNHENVFDQIGFSPGSVAGVVDNFDLDETQAVASPGTSLSWLTKFPFFFSVNSSNQVDWNRDGQLTSSVKAMFAPAPRQFDCPGARLYHNRETSLPVGSRAVGGAVEVASFIRNGSPALYIFWVDTTNGQLRYNYTTQSHGGWSTAQNAEGGLRTEGSPTSARFTVGGAEKLLIMAPGALGNTIQQWVIEADGTVSGPVTVTPTSPAPSVNAIRELTLLAHYGKAHVIYRDETSTFGQVHMGTCSSPPCTATSWGSFVPMEYWDADYAVYKMFRSSVTPGLAALPDGTVYAFGTRHDWSAYPTGLFRSTTAPLTPTGWTWDQSIVWQDEQRGTIPQDLRRPVVEGRPSLVYVPHWQGGSGRAPLSTNNGYLAAWYRSTSNEGEFWLSEGWIGPTGHSFSVGNHRFIGGGDNDEDAGQHLAVNRAAQ